VFSKIAIEKLMCTRLDKHPQHLRDQFEKYSPKVLDTGYLSHLQPLPAYLGLVGCLATVIGFSSASWWEGGSNVTSILAAFLLVSTQKQDFPDQYTYKFENSQEFFFSHGLV
jgi:hypothetical protein